MALCQTESASARRYAASLGTYGIEEATLKRLSAFAEMSEKACASLHRLLANDAKPEEKELEAITQGLSEEKLWFTGVRGGYEQMLKSALKAGRKSQMPAKPKHAGPAAAQPN